MIWIGSNRTEKTVHEFFDWLGNSHCSKIKAVCSDMWKAYVKVIKNRIPNARHVLDRFHIAQHLNKAVDKVRASEHKKLIADAYDSVLFKSRWLLLKRRSKLDAHRDVSLKELLKYNLRTMRAYLLKEQFDIFWSYSSPAWAGKFLDEWCTRAMRSKIVPMKKKAQMLRKHKPLILNWFRAKGELFSGAFEELNLKAKLTARKSYGFRNPEMQILALYHSLGNLPVPEWTHKFC